ncbi:MAG TPA: TldD/PmbA family protein [Gemmatimonadales bacterium]|nr:TldD/PmbA family protein [Gemmatimonadales bacterium]
MKNLLSDALRVSRADYTDIRLERTWATAIGFRGSRLEGATTGVETGGLVRCLNRGYGWGITSFTGLDQLLPMLARAHELSLAAPRQTPLRLAEIPARHADDLADLDGDVRGVPLGEKRLLLEQLNQEMLAVDRRIVDSQAAYEDRVVERWLGTSQGVLLSELRTEVRLAAAAVAREDSFVERAFESWATRGGWRSVRDTDHLFRQAGRRAVALLNAPRARGGVYPVVLDPRLAGTLVHHTLGHLSEADMLAGRADADQLMRPGRRVGSELLTVGDDGSAPGLLGSHSFDDEGAPTQNTLLVQHGVIVGRVHTRETAALAGVTPTGNGRAGSFRHPPAARLSNTYVANGRGTLEDLIRDIRFGIYCVDALAVESHLGRFAITAAHGQLIRDGRLAEPIRPVVLAGDMLETLGRIDAVAGDFRWAQLASCCTRGDAGPLPVAEGAPHLRIDGVNVGADLA